VWLCAGLARVLERLMARPPLTWNVVAGITQDANLDNAEARRDLGYNPIGVHEGFRRCFPQPGSAPQPTEALARS
jgi:hypothetical protein